MFLSVIVISYESERELTKTLTSLSPGFQRNITKSEYEVIVVDNGSRRPPTVEQYADLGLDLRVLHVEDPTPSPVAAVNLGLDSSCGAAMGVFIDGARLASPGLLWRTRQALGSDERAVVGARGRYLGPMMQRRSMKYGYNQAVEDALLERIDWTRNGYDLFKVSIFDETSRPTWHSQVGETNALFMRRGLWAELGGFDPAFTTPGGGFVNLDAWERACNLASVSPILLLGEATFHQFHGGVATNSSKQDVDKFRQEYIAIRGRDHRRPTAPVTFWGSFESEPPEEELVRERFSDAVQRMASGPMHGLLDLGASAGGDAAGDSSATPTTRPSDAVAKMRATVRGAGRRLPAPVNRSVRSAGRRLPPKIRIRVKRLAGR